MDTGIVTQTNPDDASLDLAALRAELLDRDQNIGILTAECTQLHELLTEAVQDSNRTYEELEELKLQHSQLLLRHRALQDRTLYLQTSTVEGHTVLEAQLIHEVGQALQALRSAQAALADLTALTLGPLMGETSADAHRRSTPLLESLDATADMLEATLSKTSGKIEP